MKNILDVYSSAKIRRIANKNGYPHPKAWKSHFGWIIIYKTTIKNMLGMVLITLDENDQLNFHPLHTIPFWVVKNRLKGRRDCPITPNIQEAYNLAYQYLQRNFSLPNPSQNITHTSEPGFDVQMKVGFRDVYATIGNQQWVIRIWPDLQKTNGWQVKGQKIS